MTLLLCTIGGAICEGSTITRPKLWMRSGILATPFWWASSNFFSKFCTWAVSKVYLFDDNIARSSFSSKSGHCKCWQLMFINVILKEEILIFYLDYIDSHNGHQLYILLALSILTMDPLQLLLVFYVWYTWWWLNWKPKHVVRYT
jgi:hypothetical protein